MPSGPMAKAFKERREDQQGQSTKEHGGLNSVEMVSRTQATSSSAQEPRTHLTLLEY